MGVEPTWEARHPPTTVLKDESWRLRKFAQVHSSHEHQENACDLSGDIQCNPTAKVST